MRPYDDVLLDLPDLRVQTSELAEALELLELDLRNFKSRLHRGRMALRRRLEELAEG